MVDQHEHEGSSNFVRRPQSDKNSKLYYLLVLIFLMQIALFVWPRPFKSTHGSVNDPKDGTAGYDEVNRQSQSQQSFEDLSKRFNQLEGASASRLKLLEDVLKSQVANVKKDTMYMHQKMDNIFGINDPHSEIKHIIRKLDRNFFWNQDQNKDDTAVSSVKQFDSTRKAIPVGFDCDETNLDIFYPLPPHEVVKTNPGFEMFVYSGPDAVSQTVRTKGEWAGPWDGELPPESNVIDVGGNICWWTLAWLHAGHTVTTFEPLRSNVNLCVHSICRNNFQDRATLYNIGLGDKVQVCQLWSQYGNFGNAVTYCDGKSTVDHSSDAAVLEPRDVFNVFPLDQVIECPEDGRGYEFMKVDTEGWIMPIIKGGLEVIKCTKRSQIEVWQGENVDEIRNISAWGCASPHDMKDPEDMLQTCETNFVGKDQYHPEVYFYPRSLIDEMKKSEK